VIGPRIGFDPAQYFDAIDLRQLQIEQNHLRAFLDFSLRVRPCREYEIQCFGAIFDDEYFVGQVLFLKCSQRQLNIVRVILHKEDLNIL